jgi:two-component system, chemotaxis family, protein-glutamate methylesterase/glutaminase
VTTRDIIVIGASAGGVHALSETIAGLPADLPAAVFAVLHLSPFGRSALPAILGRACALPAEHPADGEPIRRGRIYVAPPDRHLALEPDRIRLSMGPTENGHRPAIDVLFRTAAESFGRRVIGVVLTGNLDDGTAGLALVKDRHGIAVVQDPEEAEYPSMPASALRNVAVDYALPIAEIGPLLDRLTRAPFPDEPESSLAAESAEDRGREPADEHEKEGGRPSGFTCPECGGALFQSFSGKGSIHFRCRTGHAYSPESLVAKQATGLEAALWAAIRALEERAALSRRIEKRMHDVGRAVSMERFSDRAQRAERHAEILRDVLFDAAADPALD